MNEKRKIGLRRQRAALIYFDLTVPTVKGEGEKNRWPSIVLLPFPPFHERTKPDGILCVVVKP
jgi:hypothetical protein